MTQEEYYDALIAPQLLGIAKLCEAHGMSLVVVCEWEPGQTGRTTTIRANADIGIRMVDTAAKAHGNLDVFMMACQRHAEKYGHNSCILSVLGVPTKSERHEAPAGAG